MFIQQQKIQLSSYSGLYDLIVPKDKLLRKINELIDFLFNYEFKIIAKLNPSITQVLQNMTTDLIATKMPTDLFVRQDIWRYVKRKVEPKIQLQIK